MFDRRPQCSAHVRKLLPQSVTTLSEKVVRVFGENRLNDLIGGKEVSKLDTARSQMMSEK